MSHSSSTCWKLGIVSVLGVCATAGFGDRALAQSITLDGTLGSAGTLNGPTYVIPQAAGQTVDTNLFHSFGQFGLNTGETAIFDSAANISNILSRVTGGQASFIDGLILTTSPSVNLFLINPSGVIFGPNAALDIGGTTKGSFVATTVDALTWSNGGQFSATNPGGSSSLLTLVGDPSGFLGSLRPPQPIFGLGSLSVYPSQSLLLLGGNVELYGARLNAPGGRVEIGGLNGAETVGLNSDFGLSFPAGVGRSDVFINDGTQIDVRAGSGGNIGINAQNLQVSGASFLSAGIASGQGLDSSALAGDITLDATDTISLEQASFIENNVNRNAFGNSGNVNVRTGLLFVSEGAQIQTLTRGFGNTGAISITADEIFLTGIDSSRNPSGIVNNVEAGAEGNAGTIEVNTGLLDISDGAQIQALTRGLGNAGVVDITASDVVLSGVNNGTTSGIFSTIGNPEAEGTSGVVSIQANVLDIFEGAQIQTLTRGQGDAGVVVLDVNNISVSGFDANTGIPSGIFSSVEEGAQLRPIVEGEERGFGILISTNSLSVSNGGRIVTDTSGVGTAGVVSIDATADVTVTGQGSTISSNVSQTGVGDAIGVAIAANNIFLSDGAEINSSTFGTGDAGGVFLQANESVALSNGNILTTVETGAIGNAGVISIDTDFLSVSNGGQIQALTRGFGNAGIVDITAENIILSGANNNSFSGIYSTIENPETAGVGGRVRIQANSLSLLEGAQIQTLTRGQGDPGSVGIDANTILVSGFDPNTGTASAIFSSVEEGAQLRPMVEGEERGFGILIDTDSLLVSDGGRIVTDTSGVGTTGVVAIQSSGDVFVTGNRSAISSNVNSTGVGDALGVAIAANNIFLSDGAEISSSTFGRGNAGGIFLQANQSVALGEDGKILTTVETGAIGNAGLISIDTGLLSISSGGQIQALTRGLGNAGVVGITASDIVLSGVNNGNPSGIFSTVENPEAEGTGGVVSIQANALDIFEGAQIQTLTRGQGDAGSVILDVSNISVSGFDANTGIPSAIFSSVEEGAQLRPIVEGEERGFGILINTDSLSISNGGRIITDTSGIGTAGVIFIQSSGDVSLTGDRTIISSNVRRTGVGNAVGVALLANSVAVNDGAQISSSTFGIGDAGSVIIQANESVSLADGDIFTTVEPRAEGTGGAVSINTDSLVLTDSAVISANTSGLGDAGDVIVQANNSIAIRDGGTNISTSVTPTGQGEGGNITLRSRTLSLTGGGEVIAQTLGQGEAGVIDVNATNLVELSGVAPFPLLENGTIGGFSSGLFSTSEEGASGNGGEINVTTNNLRVADGATISARSRSAFVGGDITVNARELEVTGGGQLLSTAFSSGDAGNITINVSDRITISGTDPTYFQRFNSVAEIFGQQQARQTLDTINPASGIFADTDIGSTGDGGSIFIDPVQFTVSDGARVSVSSLGQGNGGNLQIQAQNITLDRDGAIEATTASGEGGNINIQAQDLLLLRRNSNISTAAGGSGNGGNIDIDTTFIVAQPVEDSNIIADAIAGRGGNINISAQGIFGIQSRPEQTPQSDITASSELGIDGTVDLNTPDVDPAQGLVTLPVETVDASNQIAAGCTNSSNSVASNKFTVTGRGGLPPNPGDTLGGEEVLTDWATLEETEVKNPQSATTNSSRKNSPTQQVVEAQGWVIDAQGKVILTAQAPEVTPNSNKLNTGSCQK